MNPKLFYIALACGIICITIGLIGVVSAQAQNGINLNITKLWLDAGLIRPFNTNVTGMTVISNQLTWPAVVIYQGDGMIIIHSGYVDYTTDSANRFWHAVDIVREQGGYEIKGVIPVMGEYGTEFDVVLSK